MFQLLLKLLFVILAVRLLGSVFGYFRKSGAGARPVPRGNPSDEGDKPDYGDLSSYPIEDAEYEEIPKDKN